MRRAAFGLGFAVVGYLCGAVGGGLLVDALSSNRFDRDVEAAMTGAFVLGPLVGLVALVIGVWRGGRPRRGAGP